MNSVLAKLKFMPLNVAYVYSFCEVQRFQVLQNGSRGQEKLSMAKLIDKLVPVLNKKYISNKIQYNKLQSDFYMERTRNNRQFFQIMRPKQINDLPMLKFSFSNKEDLRSIITDYVLHHIEEESRGIPSRRFKSKHIKYPNINLKVNINKEEKEISIEFVNFLSKYIEIEKKNIYRQGTIEPLVVDILNFIDELEEKTRGIIFEIDMSNGAKRVQQQVLNLIIEKHHKDKQKNYYAVEIQEYNKRKVIAKHARISYIDIQDQLKKKQKQFLLQISDLGNIDLKSDPRYDHTIIIPTPTSTISDSLNSLIQSGQIFDSPDKIQALKKQKLLQFYNSNELQYLSYETQLSNQVQELNCNKFSSQCMKMLKNWIVDIGISQRYYQIKYGKNQKQRKGKDRGTYAEEFGG